ncbi:hypothetical protein EK21DRAFT_84083 [Setomelanomma holmii]|uniref:Uncharacterized protein n=1 Tax=Setomelanomma holmii TaxID=210430 RepID=A0A9P4HNE2_9PLEO|nr:hypothetical protein EK21DRAFT_84083 [Setomelanomma holmii]
MNIQRVRVDSGHDYGTVQRVDSAYNSAYNTTSTPPPGTTHKSSIKPQQDSAHTSSSYDRATHDSRRYAAEEEKSSGRQPRGYPQKSSSPRHAYHHAFASYSQYGPPTQPMQNPAPTPHTQYPSPTAPTQLPTLTPVAEKSASLSYAHYLAPTAYAQDSALTSYTYNPASNPYAQTSAPWPTSYAQNPAPTSYARSSAPTSYTQSSAPTSHTQSSAPTSYTQNSAQRSYRQPATQGSPSRSDLAQDDIRSQEPFLSWKQEKSTPPSKAHAPPDSRILKAVNHSEETLDIAQPLTKAMQQIERTPPQMASVDQNLSGTADESAEECDIDHAMDLKTQKEQILDRLMLCVYEMFAQTTFHTRGGHDGKTSSCAPQHRSSSSTSSSKYKGKRSYTNEQGRDDDRDENEDDDSRKRPRIQTQFSGSGSQDRKRLACPYFKHAPLQTYSSRACYGPGWPSIHRMKYLPFQSRSTHLSDYITENTCIGSMPCLFIVGDAICVVADVPPPEGFTQDQETALKGRRSMFRAGSEEEKWKIIYLILFPDTALGQVPAPYYDETDDEPQQRANDQSPKPPELREFDAFLRRELPRKIRKELQAALENVIGPIEETLKSDLENIVRNCQETLTRSYFDAAQLTVSSNKKTAEAMVDEPPVITTDDSRFAPPTTEANIGPNSLSQFFVPPETISESWPEVSKPSDELKDGSARTKRTDSAYVSCFDFDPDSFLHDAELGPQQEGGTTGLCDDCGLEHDPSDAKTGCPFNLNLLDDPAWLTLCE